MAEKGLVDSIKNGNLKSMRTIADVRDAVKAYYLLVTVNPVGESTIILRHSFCSVERILTDLMVPHP